MAFYRLLKIVLQNDVALKVSTLPMCKEGNVDYFNLPIFRMQLFIRNPQSTAYECIISIISYIHANVC